MFLLNRLHRPLLVVLLTLLIGSAAWGGTVGKISGVVTSAGNGQPLVGANVVILGTSMGATADADGAFFMLNVPAGSYELQATIVGYRPMVIDEVRVAPDFTTEVAIELQETVLGIIETVEVRAEKPLVRRDLTSTARFLEREDVQNLPTRGYQEAAGMQAGIITQPGNSFGLETTNSPRLHVRGGRAEEVAYFVDGFSQQDPLTGLATTSINQNAIDQIVVLTGGFNAEYGKVMSGAVNVITREGANDYFGSVEMITDNLAGDWVGAKAYDYNIYDVALGGPVLPGNDRLTFFASGERRWQRDRAPKPIDALGLSSEHEALYDSGRLLNNSLSGYTWQAKLAWEASRSLKFRGGTLGSLDNWREYRHTYLFDDAHMPRYEDTNRSLFGTMTHTINSRAFYTVGVNWFYTERYRGDGVHFKDLDSYSRLDGNPTYDQELPLFWEGASYVPVVDPVNGDTTWAFSDATAHVWDDFLHRESSYLGMKGDLSVQWRPYHQAKIGAEYRYHTLRRYRHLNPYQVGGPGGDRHVDRFGYYPDDPDRHLDGDYVDPESGERYPDGAKHPKDASFYVQNKYEMEGFVVNAGLRYDYLDVESKVFADETMPLGEDGADLDIEEDLKDSNERHKLSPRLGVGFPVGDETLFHANYGIFYQQPNLEDLYTGYQYVEWKAGNGGYYYPFGNPSLTPETTTAYEIGFTKQVSERSRFDVTAFYKSVQDLVQVQNIRSSPYSYASFRNTDYGTIKGIDFSFDTRRTRNISATINYTWSFANGTGSVSNTQRNIAWTAGNPPKQTAPLDFDQRHKIAVDFDWRLQTGEGPVLGSLRPLENTGINLLVNIGSGNPYTPTRPYDEVTLANVSTTPEGPINSEYGPWRYRVDAKVDRGFEIGGLRMNAFMWVLNVFDRKNPISVYTSTGDSGETGWLYQDAGRSSYSTPEAQTLYELAQSNPNNYDCPRMFRFGLKTSF